MGNVMSNATLTQNKGHRQLRVAKLETVLRNVKGNGVGAANYSFIHSASAPRFTC